MSSLWQYSHLFYQHFLAFWVLLPLSSNHGWHISLGNTHQILNPRVEYWYKRYLPELIHRSLGGFLRIFWTCRHTRTSPRRLPRSSQSLPTRPTWEHSLFENVSVGDYFSSPSGILTLFESDLCKVVNTSLLLHIFNQKSVLPAISWWGQQAFESDPSSRWGPGRLLMDIDFDIT
jgi:hypothetical protein